MPSNLLFEEEQLLIIESRMTVDEVLEVLDITLPELLLCLPEGSVERLIEYLDNE